MVNWKSVPWVVPGEAQSLPPWDFDDASTDRQPHAHAGRLGGEERIKDAMTDRFLDSNSRVPDRDLNAAFAVDLRFNPQDARSLGHAAHGIRSVHDQVHDDLLQLDAISQCKRKVRGQRRLNGHRTAPQRGPRQRQDLPDRVIRVERNVVRLAMFEQLANARDHLACTRALLDDAFERLRYLLDIGGSVGQPSERSVSIGDDRRERLVDFMGDGRRELTHRREPRHARELRLRLVHGRVGADALGLVRRDANVLLSGLVERLADAMKVLDRPVAQLGAERDVEGFPVPGSPAHCSLPQKRDPPGE